MHSWGPLEGSFFFGTLAFLPLSTLLFSYTLYPTGPTWPSSYSWTSFYWVMPTCYAQARARNYPAPQLQKGGSNRAIATCVSRAASSFGDDGPPHNLSASSGFIP